MKNKLIKDFTHGSVPRQLVAFMLPFMASNALQVVYSLVDMIIVGRFVGSAGLAGVSQGGLLIIFSTTFCLGFSNSGQIYISQLIGAEKRGELGHVIGTLFSVTALMGVVITAIIVGLHTWILSFLQVPEEAFSMASSYALICGLGFISTCGYNTVSGILRGIGDSRHPFVFITISSVLNLLLDLLMTGYWGMGVAGAALATVISQLVSFVVSLTFLYRHRDEFAFDFKLRSFRIDREDMKKLMKLGLPLAVQACAINISMMICSAFINAVGVVATATFGVGIKVDDIANKLSQGIQYAASPMVGQNVGAGNSKRVKSVICWAWLMSGAVYLLFFLAYISFGREIFAVFTDDAAVIELAPVFIIAISFSFPGMAIMRGTHALLQGTGSSKMIMCLAFADAGLRVILSYLIGIVLDSGFFGFVLGFGLASYGIALPGMIYFFTGRWKNKSLVK